MTSELDELVTLLDLEPEDGDVFKGRSREVALPWVFGGQVAAQALAAAGRTVRGGPVHSLHAYFLRPGDPAAPIRYHVDRLRDGRSFTTRAVVATQRAGPIFTLCASFHRDEPGLDHQPPAPEVPAPETLRAFEDLLAPWPERLREWWPLMGAFETRCVDPPPVAVAQTGAPQPRTRLWMRTRGPLRDDPLDHACLLTYASDIYLLDTAAQRHGFDLASPGVMAASLDHAMWFHRNFRADEWLLFDHESPSAGGGRALLRAAIFSRAGRLVASVVQEGLIRRGRRADR
ncbi:MAG TPA: acyl-CoA thioesterase II [Candidatus Dormibacteraeota bacterium]